MSLSRKQSKISDQIESHHNVIYITLQIELCHARRDVDFVMLCFVQYEQLTDLRLKFEGSLQRQDELHAKYDLNLTVDNLKVAALQAEEEAECTAEQFLTGMSFSIQRLLFDRYRYTFIDIQAINAHIYGAPLKQCSQRHLSQVGTIIKSCLKGPWSPKLTYTFYPFS